MNIFLTTDLFSEYIILHELEEILKDIDLSKCTIITTNRYQDKPFVSYALMKGSELKIYSIKDYLTDAIIEKVAYGIDYLIIFSSMSNFFYQRLFAVCDRTIYIDGERKYIDELRRELKSNYDKKVERAKKKRENTVDLYQEEVVDKLKQVQRVKIKIIDMGINSG